MHVTFARETLTDAAFEEARPLLTAHWREIAHFPDIPLDPDVAGYCMAEASGNVRFFTARSFDPVDQSTPLVGYAVFFVRRNLHYKSSLQAAQDVLFVDPGHRGTLGYRFIRWCDEQLAGEGVQVVAHHAKNAHPQLSRLLPRIGYHAVDTIWVRRLDGDHNGDRRGSRDGLLDLQRGTAEEESQPIGELASAVTTAPIDTPLCAGQENSDGAGETEYDPDESVGRTLGSPHDQTDIARRIV